MNNLTKMPFRDTILPCQGEYMEEKILNILKYYEDNNLKADNNFVKYILIILIEYYHIEKYLEKVVIFNGKGNTSFSGMYSPKHKRMLVDISTDYSKNIKMNNIQILLTILHELVHVLQLKYLCDGFCMEKDYSIYRLMELGFRNDGVYEENPEMHDYFTTERLAIIKSTYRLIKIISLDTKRYKKEINELKLILYDYYMDGYDIFDREKCPLNIYSNIIENDSEIKSLDFSQQESTSKKVLYGLPITQSEYNFLRDKMLMYAEVLSKKKK